MQRVEEVSMFDTKNDLPVNTRTKVIDLLNARLADAIDLGAQTKHAHWNVKGPNFIALHELFDKVAEHVEDYVDTIAERVTSLGGRLAARSRQWCAPLVSRVPRRHLRGPGTRRGAVDSARRLRQEGPLRNR